MRVLSSFLALCSLLSGHLPAAVTLGLPASSDTPPLAEAAGNPANAAIEAFNKGRQIEAVRLARPLAEDGNAEALLIMGVAHEAGPTRELAIDYLRKAHQAGNRVASHRLVRQLVEQGSKDSQQEARTLLETLAKHDRGVASRLLGEGFLRGWFGGKADFEKARYWWEQAAERGDMTALLSLAGLLDGSFGFPDKRDPETALALFLKAAKLGNPGAMASAGSRLLNGGEKIRDEQSGRQWLAKAIASEQIDAYLALGDFEETIKQDDEAAFAQYKQGAEAGQSGCMLKLATFFTDGRGGQDKNPAAALAWLKKAGEAGNALGHYQAAAILLNREEFQIREGFAHLVAAAEAGLPDVQNEVGLFYLSERLGPRDPTAAAGWFGRAAAGGSPKGAFNLGLLYEQGIGVPRNPGEAGRLYTQAANAGHPQATSALGRLHAQGAGTKQDLPKAWALISLAIERGAAEATGPLRDLASQLTAEQLTEGRRQLTEFKSHPPKPDDPKPDDK